MVQLGASGVLCGTRFVASSESDAHPAYKQALVDAGADATARSLCYDLGWPDAPHRTLISDTYRDWVAAGSPPMGKRPGEGDVMFRGKGLEVPRYFVSPPKAGMTGDILEGALYAGTGVERIAAVQPAAEIVRSLSAGLN